MRVLCSLLIQIKSFEIKYKKQLQIDLLFKHIKIVSKFNFHLLLF